MHVYLHTCMAKIKHMLEPGSRWQQYHIIRWDNNLMNELTSEGVGLLIIINSTCACTYQVKGSVRVRVA